MIPSYSRRDFLTSTLAATITPDFEMQVTSQPSKQRPNLLWISAEDMNPHLGCYKGIYPGAEYAITPNLDKFASEGVRFDTVCATSPVCAPSRSGIITAMFPTAVGSMHMRSQAVPHRETRCFTEYLRAAGYYCTNNSKTDYNFESPITAWDESSRDAHWRNRPNKNQPFFAVMNLTVTHESQIRATEEQYQRNTASLAPAERHSPDKAPLPPYYPDTPITRRDWARYHDNITAMDKQAAAILKQLEEDGLAENTLVLFWGDHGAGLPRAKRWTYESGLRVPLLARWKGKLLPGTNRKELISLMDLGATMLACAGLPIPTHLHGQPIFDAEGRPNKTPRTFLCGHRDRMDEAHDRVRTIRDARYRYILNYHPDRPYAQYIAYAEEMPTLQELRRLHKDEANARGMGQSPTLLTPVQRRYMAPYKPKEEMYDLDSDPFETVNLADDPNYKVTKTRLADTMKDWFAKIGDLGAVPEAELVEKWRPEGKWSVTEAPVVRKAGDKLTATSVTPGASIGYTFDISVPRARQRWLLYTAPVAIPAGKKVWFRACRLGYRESSDTQAEG